MQSSKEVLDPVKIVAENDDLLKYFSTNRSMRRRIKVKTVKRTPKQMYQDPYYLAHYMKGTTQKGGI